MGDVVRANNSSRFNVYGTSMLSPEQNFFLMSLIDSFPAEWRAFAKSFTDSSLIEEILRKKQIPPSAKRKLTDKYPDINVEWDKVSYLPFRSTLESKTREFQYKILNCIVYTNERLYRFGLVVREESDEYHFFLGAQIGEITRSTSGLSKLRPAVERVISPI